MSVGSKRRAADTLGDRDSRYNYNKVDPRLSAEEQITALQLRLEGLKNGMDDELMAECEVLSRKRDEKLHALFGKGLTAKPSNARLSVEGQRRTICDDFESEREGVKERLRREVESG
eukprot:CAMPEP_0202824682 /NCGR_PEP_ID=MMETSP1389-20130828/12515_1 /ASSEMBLY_ACC=CAM_ASM_000865 /TAXON_ID=302021 /ORGANISM="Rhodomonas sp., Strain CCMP768" /LENGTH=116 /DNA_ID=CAMNT_0049497803 /DNA_START=44 /DNA_END=391 /DNA_ORIENTATION=-